MGAAISENGVLMHIPIIGPYNTKHIFTFLDTFYRDLIHEHERGQIGDDLPKVHHSLGQCQFPTPLHHQAMVCDPQKDADGVPLTTYPFTPLRIFS